MASAAELLASACTSGISCLSEKNLLVAIAQGASVGGGGGGGGGTLSTDGTFAANSDLLYPSQKAAKTYIDAAVAGVGGAYVLKAGDTMTGPLNMTAGQSYRYNGVNVLTAQTALSNYYFGPSGNLTGTGTNNTAGGYQSLLVNTTGIGNTAFGSISLFSNTSGAQNTAFGYGALAANTTAGNGIAFGFLALTANTTGANNLAFGLQALTANTTGANNIAIGNASLASNISGNQNTAIGYLALLIGTGNNNTAIGFQAGDSLTSGNNNLIVGFDVDAPVATGSNQLVLANILFGTGCSGTGTTIAGSIGIGQNTPLARLHITPAASGTDYFRIDHSDGTPRIQIGALTGSITYGALWFGDIVPSATNYGLASDGGTLRVGSPLAIPSGSNQRAGNATLVGGTLTVLNTTVTANTLIFLTRKTTGGTIGFAVTYTVIAATSFTITSDNVLDTSTYSYILVENP